MATHHLQSALDKFLTNTKNSCFLTDTLNEMALKSIGNKRYIACYIYIACDSDRVMWMWLPQICDINEFQLETTTLPWLLSLNHSLNFYKLIHFGTQIHMIK